MEELARGKSLDGRFELLERLEHEGLEEAWLALDTELGERVVARLVPPDLSPEELYRLKDRVRRLRKLHHPNIVAVHELYRTEAAVFITLPQVEGEPLARYRGRPLATILPLVRRIALAIDFAHRQGVVHGNLRLSSVLVDDALEPRLTDVALVPGRELEPSEDVRALGELLRELSGEASPEMERLFGASPPTLRDVLTALDRLETTPPGEEVRRERRIVLTPPPRPVRRASEVEGFALTRPSRPRAGGVGWMTGLAFVALLGVALAVFLVLPGWVAERAPSTAPGAPAVEPVPEPDPPAALEDLEALAPAKTRAEQARARAVELADALDARGAAEWNGPSFRAALDAIERGDALAQKRDYGAATEAFEGSREALEKLEAGASERARNAVRKGEASLASGRSREARESFELALRIEPDNGAAKRGLRRAGSLDEVLGLIASAEERERAKDLKGAAELYRRAAALDPLSSAAAKGLSRVDAKASEAAFQSAMSEGLQALGAKDFSGARAAFERAETIRPGASEAAEAIAQTKEGERLETIARRREAARAYERDEAWRKAEAEYRAVLAIDPTIRFAIDGAAHAQRRAELHENIDFQLAHSERLSDAAALEEASGLLQEASKTEPSGPALERKVAALDELVRTYSTHVEVQLLSDNETEVIVYRVGRLGKFDRRALELRPGTYTVVGSREGYRDVRRELVVRVDAPPEPLVVRCEERI